MHQSATRPVGHEKRMDGLDFVDAALQTREKTLLTAKMRVYLGTTALINL